MQISGASECVTMLPVVMSLSKLGGREYTCLTGMQVVSMKFKDYILSFATIDSSL